MVSWAMVWVSPCLTKQGLGPAFEKNASSYPLTKQVSDDDSFMREPANPYATNATPMRPFTPSGRPRTDSRERLVDGAMPLGGVGGSPPRGREPTLPNVNPQGGRGEYGGYRGVAY